MHSCIRSRWLRYSPSKCSVDSSRPQVRIAWNLRLWEFQNNKIASATVYPWCTLGSSDNCVQDSRVGRFNQCRVEDQILSSFAHRSRQHNQGTSVHKLNPWLLKMHGNPSNMTLWAGAFSKRLQTLDPNALALHHFQTSNSPKAIRISRAAYPNRMVFREFVYRFAPLATCVSADAGEGAKHGRSSSSAARRRQDLAAFRQ